MHLSLSDRVPVVLAPVFLIRRYLARQRATAGAAGPAAEPLHMHALPAVRAGSNAGDHKNNAALACVIDLSIFS